MKKNDIIKRKIYELRRLNGYSQEYMASTLNMSLNSYRKIEKGETTLVSYRLDQIAQTLGTEVETLIYDSETTRPSYSLAEFERQDLLSTIELLKKQISYLERIITLQNEKLEAYTKNQE